VRLANGDSLFLKAAVDANTTKWLRREHLVYSQLRAPFMPQLRGWHDDEFPVLLLEDLSACHWPPPWTAQHIDAVCEALHQLAATPVSSVLQSTLPRMEDCVQGKAALPGWKEVEQNPGPFLSLNIASSAWLEVVLPTLREAADAVPLQGSSLVHNDVRGDNLCLRNGRAILVDWNWTRIGNGFFDVAGWLPSLHADGGPLPEAVLNRGTFQHIAQGERAGYAAFLAGYFASQAGLPPIPGVPRVRPLQLQQLSSALPWALRALQLPQPY
jgi:hypothetical protein